jgi:Holliday junction DNA helicase RuvA
MITKITGKLTSVEQDVATLEVNAFEYTVLIPEFARRQLQFERGQEVSLHTIQYLEGNPTQGKLTPRLIGFINVAEREFFELFCSVDGVGVRKALRAMVRPVAEVAAMIEEQDPKGLSTLPGIGPATAERIIAKLRRKVPKFALLVSQEMGGEDEALVDVATEAFEVLRTLGHSESDARRMLEPIMGAKKKYKDVEQLINDVYAHQRSV